jgi:hypothetical protein
MNVRRVRTCLGAVIAIAITACASGPPELPYPAFVQADDLPDIFMASLPGIRAKQFAGDAKMRTTSNRVDLPPGWKGTSGGSPGKSLEIFVLNGNMAIAGIVLARGGYAYLPAGSLGFNLRTLDGARILYFIDNVGAGAVIRAPIILDSGILDWQASDIAGLGIKELRADPGSGARTWLLKIQPGATLPWEVSSMHREGYLVGGDYRHSECVEGKAETGLYTQGGYFYRPPNTINGGPDSAAITESFWLLREAATTETRIVPACVASDPAP